MAKKNKDKKNKKKDKKAKDVKKPEISISDVLVVSNCHFGPPKHFQEKYSDKFIESDTPNLDDVTYVKMWVKLENSGLKVQNVLKCLSGYDLFNICQVSRENQDNDVIKIICWSTAENEMATLKTMELALL